MANPTLEYSSRGGEVSWLKERLNWWGYYDQAHPDAALGAEVYGWDAFEAVRKFQTAYGIAPTGQVDDATWYWIDQAQRGVMPAGAPTAPGAGPGAGTAPAPGINPGATTPQSPDLQRDALARLGSLLQGYGLNGMLDWVKSKLIAGASEAEIQLEMYEQPAFKARFPVIDARRAAGLNPVSVAEVLEYETRGRELMRRAGITQESFMARDYLQGLMIRDVSLAEVQDRLNEGLLRVQNAPPEVRSIFGSWFGTNSDAAMAQLFLDPDKALPELEKMAATAVAGGIGKRYGLELAQGIAREIADTGVSDGAIWQGFAQLDSMRDLFSETISETQDLTMEGEGIDAVFNTGPGGQRTLERRLQSRSAAFKGGGNAAATEKGVIGLGVADS